MNKVLLIFLICTMTACGKKSVSAAGDISEEAVVETGIGVVSGLSDEQAGENYAMLRSSKTEQMFAVVQNVILPQAQADVMCGRAVLASCSAGMRQADYVSCQPSGSHAVLSGYVRLSYTQANCTLNSVGDRVDRTYQLDFSGPRGGVATVSSVSAQDYRGQTYGGGAELTRTGTGYLASVAGKHVAVNYEGRELYSVSIHTLSPIGITGTLGRSNRLVDGGTIEVNHNRRAFTATIQPHNLQWQSGCCYPVSGTLDVQYTGSRTNSATITFNGCGAATRSANGTDREMNLSYCE